MRLVTVKVLNSERVFNPFCSWIYNDHLQLTVKCGINWFGSLQVKIDNVKSWQVDCWPIIRALTKCYKFKTSDTASYMHMYQPVKLTWLWNNTEKPLACGLVPLEFWTLDLGKLLSTCQVIALNKCMS